MAGSWDCYCAICAGVMASMGIRYARRREPSNGDADAMSGTESGQGEAVEDDTEGDDEDEGGSDEDDAYSYDPNVVSRRDVLWVDDCRQLGFNRFIGKGYLSGPGRYDDYGAMQCEPGNDPNRDDADLLFCYIAPEIGRDNEYDHPVFPFHWECYQLFCRYLTGSDNLELIDKDVLYRTMERLPNAYCLNLEYDEPGTGIKVPHDQTWDSSPGHELYVSSPSTTPQLTARVRDDVSGRTFIMCSIDSSLGSKVRSDPFSRFPMHLMNDIISYLDAECLVNLLCASWYLHSARHDDNGFWKQRIKSSLGWFFELHQYIYSDASSSIVSMKAVYFWALKVTKPRLHLKGTYMPIANRRRIWGVCRQLANLYLTESQIIYIDVEDAIINHAVCQHTAVVSSPFNLPKDHASFYWIPSREALTYRKTVETFWDAEGYLVGIAVTVKKGEQMVFGVNENEYGVKGQSFELEEDNWITGVVLHIPRVDIIPTKHREEASQDADVSLVSPRGITFRTSAGGAICHGETEPSRHSQRPFLAPEGQIVGAEGEMDLSGEKPRILRFGLIVLPNGDYDTASDDESDQDDDMETDSKAEEAAADESDDEEADDANVVPLTPLPLLQKCLWSSEACNTDQGAIWELENISMLAFGEDSTLGASKSIHRDMVPYEAFLWAHNRDRPMAMKRLLVYTAVSGAGSESTEVSKGICNMRVEFDTSRAIDPVAARVAEVNESPIPDGSCEAFDIDGSGGERIIEVSIQSNMDLKALRLRTNRNREFIWQGQSQLEDNWETILISDEETLAGLALSFGSVSEHKGKGDQGVMEGHTVLNRMAALIMKNESSARGLPSVE